MSDPATLPSSDVSPWPLWRTLAMLGCAAGFVVTLVVIAGGGAWVQTNTETFVPGNPMVLLAVVWALAAAVALVVPVVGGRWPGAGAVVAFLCAAGGFAGVAVATIGARGAPLGAGPTGLFANPSDHLFLAVVWLVAALPLVGAGVLLLQERVACERVSGAGEGPPPRAADGPPARHRSPWLSAGRLAVIATCASLGLALLVGVRGEAWQGLDVSWDPMARLTAVWGACAVLAFAAALLLRERHWHVGGACLIAAAALGFAGSLLSGSDLGHNAWMARDGIDMWLADPTQRLQLSLVWLVAAVPLVSAAVMALRSTGGDNLPEGAAADPGA